MLKKIKFDLVNVIAIFALLVQSSCSEENTTIDTKTLNTSELKKILISDTSICKVLILYDPLCQPCNNFLDSFITSFEKKYSESIHVYMVNINTEVDISKLIDNPIITLYTLVDTSSQFSIDNNYRYIDLVHELFPESTNLKIINGIPQSFCIKSNNRLYIKMVKNNTGKLFCPMNADDLLN